MTRYTFIRDNATAWPLGLVCRVLAVSRPGYYAWKARPAPAATDWHPAAEAAFTRHAQRYGTRRLRAELHGEGHPVGRYALRSWLRTSGLRALSTRPQRPRTTQADPVHPVSENLLLDRPAPTAHDQVWVTLPICP